MLKRLLGVVGAAALLSAGSAPAAIAAFPGTNGRLAYILRGDVFTVKADGSGRRQLTDAFRVDDVQWAPRGRRLLFLRRNSGLWVMRPDGTQQRQPAGLPRFVQGAAWAPDGQQLFVTYEANNGRGPTRFAVYNIRTQTTAPVTFSRRFGFATEPAWSPDGQTVVFVRVGQPPEGDGELVTRLFSAHVDGTGLAPIPLTWGGRLPDWSPDGLRLAFARAPFSGRLHVVTVRADGTDRQRLTPIPEFDTSPAWSPDGHSIAFTRSVANEIPTLWTMTRRGTQVRQIARGSRPSWQPVPPPG